MNIIVDENYPGIIKMDGWYKIEGDLFAKTIEIKIPLFVTGSIEAGGRIEAGRWIEVGGWIEAGGSIKAGRRIEAGGSIKAGGPIEAGGLIEAGGSIKAGGSIEAGRRIKAGGPIETGRRIKAGESIEAGRWINASESINAGGWIEAGGPIEAGGGLSMYGIKTNFLLLLHGTYRFTIWIMDTHIKIGCQVKTKEEWKHIYQSDAGEKLAKELGDDGSMWAMRDVLIKFCD